VVLAEVNFQAMFEAQQQAAEQANGSGVANA
jgi:preprotein translocase subunit SecB